MFLFRIGLPFVKHIQKEQIACHGLRRRQTRIVEHLPDNIHDTPGLNDLPDVPEYTVRLVWRQHLQQPEQDRDVKRPDQGTLDGIGGHDVDPRSQAGLVYIALRDWGHRRQIDNRCLQLGIGPCEGERQTS